MGKGIGGHQSHDMKSDNWLTPKYIIEDLGPFDLDPCASEDRPWDTARKHYIIVDNGLVQPWFGRIWCNPPYGKISEKWLKKLSEYGRGTALIFARTETKMFFKYVWEKADALLFIRNRLYFYRPDGSRAKSNSGAPSVLIAYGDEDFLRLRDSKIGGSFVSLREKSFHIL